MFSGKSDGHFFVCRSFRTPNCIGWQYQNPSGKIVLTLLERRKSPIDLPPPPETPSVYAQVKRGDSHSTPQRLLRHIRVGRRASTT
jgi:hypothetical protein